MSKGQKRYGYDLIHEEYDKFGFIQVVQRKCFRSLHFGTSNKQSEVNLEYPEMLTLQYTQHMVAGLFLNPLPRRVLLLGAGGGSLARFIHHYFKEAAIDICDVREKVFEIAQKFFCLPPSPQIKFFLGDAHCFLKNNQKKYDLIFVDIFNGEGVSEAVMKKGFFSYLANSLATHGIASVNLWSGSVKAAKLFERFLTNKDRVCLKIPTDKGNVVHLSVPKNSLTEPRMEAERFADLFSQSMNIPFREIFRVIELENNLSLFEAIVPGENSRIL